jgi:tetratricopeptide (TPR) repeat protein
LAGVFAGATAVIVLAQLLCRPRRPGEWACLVEVSGAAREGHFVVKAQEEGRLRRELDGWERCRPHVLRHDLVLLAPQPHRDDQGRLSAVVYGDAQQFLGVDRPVTLEEAFLSAVCYGGPSVASVANALAELFHRVGHLFYGQSFQAPPTYPLALNPARVPVEAFPRWEEGPAREARQLANTALPLGSAASFHDPVDALDFLMAGARAGRPGDCFPALLRGAAHGDLHGQNVLVAVVDDEARWPALFDFGQMALDNLVGWDFVSLETELKVRAYEQIVKVRRGPGGADPGYADLDYARAVKDHEVGLAEATERCQAEGRWPEAGGAERAPADRLRALLLTVRRLAAVHLGRRRGRPEHWLDEYYFLLSCYGVCTGRGEGRSARERLGAFLSAGVASARYLARRPAAAGPAAPPDGDPVAEALGGRSPDFREPLRRAHGWVRERLPEPLRQARRLLEGLKERYPHALQVRYELALALSELGEREGALAELVAAGAAFATLDEDTESLWARLYKEKGDLALARGDVAEAMAQYRRAEEKYWRAYTRRLDRFPGINVGTLRLLRASLARQTGQAALAGELRQASREVAQALLAGRKGWVPRLSDDNIWMAATEAEALVLLGDWAEAERRYREARAQPNHQAFHSMSMGKQVSRLVEAYRLLGEAPQGPLADPAAFFATPGPANGG